MATRTVSKRGTKVGKRIGGYVYVHVEARAALDPEEADRLARAVAIAGDRTWNVAKIGKADVSLLLYESFDDVAFPALLQGWKIDPDGGGIRGSDYRGRTNPPILHRKELLLPADDPRRPVFAALTRTAEEAGLFVESHKIGVRRAWEERIAVAGLRIEGQKLVPIETPPQIAVARHKTAIVRRELSQPVALLVRNEILTPERSFFDYGCGQGDDVAALVEGDYRAFGWDPHHLPDGPRETADIVNLGFVINVIEDPAERRETLRTAWSFAGTAMSVAVMIAGRVPGTATLKPYRDGVLTSRGTFQKYYHQHELRDALREALGETPVALAPGIFVVFRDKAAEQEFQLRRLAGKSPQPVTLRPPRPAAAGRLPLLERARPDLERFWQEALARGRAPGWEELPGDLADALKGMRISLQRAMSVCRDEIDDAGSLEQAAGKRRVDLLIYFGLFQLSGAARLKDLSRSIQRDVKALFPSLADARLRARQLLFASGDETAIRAAAEEVVRNGLGALRDPDRLRVALPLLGRLPDVLRIRIGAGDVLHGGITNADFVDIRLDRPRLTFLTCDDAARPLPEIVERMYVDLSNLEVGVVDSGRKGRRYLFLKARYMAADDPARSAQEAFDKRLVDAGLLVPGEREPSAEEFERLARQKMSGRTARGDGEVA